MRPRRRVFPLGLCLSLYLSCIVLSGCGSTPAATPPPVTATPSDAYAALTDHQVVETFMNAYQTGDYPTCVALLAPATRAGMTSPDQFALAAQSEIGQWGAVTGWKINVYSGPDPDVRVLIDVDRARGGTTTFTANLTLQRIANTWKVEIYAV